MGDSTLSGSGRDHSITTMKEPKAYEIAGHPVTCTHCQNGSFFKRQSSPNGRRVAFFDEAWQNGGADNYICARCGHLMWFFDLPPERDSRESTFSFDALITEEETAEEEVIEPIADYETPESEMMPEPTECLSCGKMIPSYQTKCGACGWSYRNDPESAED